MLELLGIRSGRSWLSWLRLPLRLYSATTEAGDEAPPQLLELLVNVEHHIAPVLLQLGGVTIFAFIAAPVVGHAAVDGDAKIRMGPPRILHRGVLSGGAGENWEYLKQAYGAFREKHAGPTTLQVLLPDSHEAGDDLVGIIANSASS